MTALEMSVAKSVMYYNTTREIWTNLEDCFGQSTSTQLYHIHDNVDPHSFCNCTGCTCDTTKRNLKQQQNQRIINFLMKLNDDYNQIRTNILMMDDLPNPS